RSSSGPTCRSFAKSSRIVGASVWSSFNRYASRRSERSTRTRPCRSREVSTSRAVGCETPARRATSRPLTAAIRGSAASARSTRTWLPVAKVSSRGSRSRIDRKSYHMRGILVSGRGPSLARERVHSDGVDEVRRHLAGAEEIAAEDLLVRADVRRDADDRELVERALQRVALEAVGVQADAGPGRREPREHARRGRERP